MHSCSVSLKVKLEHINFAGAQLGSSSWVQRVSSERINKQSRLINFFPSLPPLSIGLLIVFFLGASNFSFSLNFLFFTGT